MCVAVPAARAILCRPLTPPYTPPSSALPHAPAQPPPPRACAAPEAPAQARGRAHSPTPLNRRGPGLPSLPTLPHPTGWSLKPPQACISPSYPAGPLAGLPSPSRPHPRVQRGRGLPQAAASASSPRGSWCLPGPTGLTRTTQPQDVRSDGTTASCHAPPLPPPPASSPPRISPPTPLSRAQDESKGEGERFTSYMQGRVYLCYPLFLLFGTAPSY